MGDTIRAEVYQTHNDVEHAILLWVGGWAYGGFCAKSDGLSSTAIFADRRTRHISIALPNDPLRARRYYFYLGVTVTNDKLYDIWDGVVTDFTGNYPTGAESFPFSIERVVGLLGLAVSGNLRRNTCGERRHVE